MFFSTDSEKRVEKVYIIVYAFIAELSQIGELHMRIQQLSEQTGISKRNIHFYIKEKLLAPKTDTTNGYYDFSKKDQEQLLLIKYFRKMGLSISDIKSLLENPASAEYYLRMHIGRLEQELHTLSVNKDNLLSILGQLPIRPTFSDLYLHTKQKYDAEQSHYNTPLYDGKLVNHFLWRTFWQQEELSEYQQYLWDKMNRLTDSREKNEHYTKIYDYLCQQDQKKINHFYEEGNTHFYRIAEFSSENLSTHVEELKTAITEFIQTPAAVKQWKEHYFDFQLPLMHIFTGEIGKLAKEMSPFYANYDQNSRIACEIVYNWLLSEDGYPLYEEIMHTLTGYVDLNNFYHTELEFMNTIFKY